MPQQTYRIQKFERSRGGAIWADIRGPGIPEGGFICRFKTANEMTGFVAMLNSPGISPAPKKPRQKKPKVLVSV